MRSRRCPPVLFYRLHFWGQLCPTSSHHHEFHDRFAAWQLCGLCTFSGCRGEVHFGQARGMLRVKAAVQIFGSGTISAWGYQKRWVSGANPEWYCAIYSNVGWIGPWCSGKHFFRAKIRGKFHEGRNPRGKCQKQVALCCICTAYNRGGWK